MEYETERSPEKMQSPLDLIDAVSARVFQKIFGAAPTEAASEQLITLLFSRARFAEAEVREWWEKKSNKLLKNDPAVLRK